MEKKRLLLFALFSIMGLAAFAQESGEGTAFTQTQTVYTEPRFITTDWNDKAETFYVYFDATKGNQGMLDAPTCYAHTGVITTASTGDGDWKHDSTWGDNDPKYQMEKVGDNLWRLEITDGLKAYYGLAEGETVTRLAFVFRTEDVNASDKQEAKEADGTDIFYHLYEPGLNVVITSPSDGLMISGNTTVAFTGESSQDADLTFTIEGPADWGTKTESVTAATSIETTQELTAQGSYTITLSAVSGEETASQSISILYEKPTEYAEMPEWMQEGINYNPGTKTVGLAFRAPHNESVFVIGDFNNWTLSNEYKMNCWETKVTNPTSNPDDTPAESDVKIFWLEFQIDDPTQKYAFQYLVDGTKKISDPYATVILDPWNDEYIEEVIDPSLPDYPSAGDGLVSVLELEDNNPYQWSEASESFKIQDPDNLIIYELHIRDFCTDSRTGQGSLDCVLERLDYLEYLGVNAIELLPVTEFDGNDSWGYNPNHFFAYDKAYGDRNLYKQFIDECHKRGIAVIIDMVFNHATGINPFAALYYDGSATTDENPWFNRVARHPFNVFHDINHEYEGTRSYFKRVLQYWLKEYRVDGFRMDLSKGLTQNNTGNDAGAWSEYDATRIPILEDYCDAVKQANPDAVFILEHLGDYSEEKVLSEYGMLPWRNMNNNYSQAAMGYASSSNFVDSDGKGGMFADGWVGYAESHDEERNFSKVKDYGEGNLQEDEAARMARVPLVMAFAHLIPGPKMLWQFGEMGYDFSINYCQDGSISEDCRTYRKPVPWTMGWDEDPLRMQAYEGAADVIRLRTTYPEYFDAANVTVQNCATSVFRGDAPRQIRVSYTDEENPANSIEIIIVGNFSATSSINPTLSFPNTGTWYDYLTGDEFNIRRSQRAIPLASGEVKILTNRFLENPTPVEETEAGGESDAVVYPSPTENMVYVNTADEIYSISVFDMAGAMVADVENSDEISLAGLSQGNYIMNVETSAGSSVHKIIKK